MIWIEYKYLLSRLTEIIIGTEEGESVFTENRTSFLKAVQDHPMLEGWGNKIVQISDGGMKMDRKGIGLERLIEYGSREAVIQNLKDAGCGQGIMECCIACMEQGKQDELLKRLEEHRTGLLHKVHKAKRLSEDALCPEEKQIDCLDYLVYQIRRCESKFG